MPLPDELQRLTPDQVSRTLDKLNQALPDGWRAGYAIIKDGRRAGQFYAMPPSYRPVSWDGLGPDASGVRWLGRLPAAALEKARGLR